MSENNGNEEMAGAVPQERLPDIKPAVQPEEHARDNPLVGNIAETDERNTSAKIADIRKSLDRLHGNYDHESRISFINSEHPGWKEYQKAYLESYLLALQIFNDRALGPNGRKPLTYEDTEGMEKFNLTAQFRDQETGQKWELVLDRRPQGRWDDDDDRGGTRITIWDHNKRGNRVTDEWPDENLEKYGDVYDLGVRMTPDGMFSFDSRRNSKWPRIFRENSLSHDLVNMRVAKNLSSLLTKAIERLESLKMTRLKVKLPRKY